MGSEIKNIIPLLTNVALIKNKYDEIAKISGENFNIFKILGLTTSEVRTHSAFLAELLNPKGHHGQGDLFLKLFLKQHELEFQTENAIVEIEKHTGFINEEYTEGGYIDIIISSSKKAIIIENKIYAGDQSKQLIRYSNYAKKAYYNNCHLLYLTLDGKDASHESKGQLMLNTDYHLISYKDDIIDWLDQCRKEAANFPIIRETITQYSNLIKHLTNQATNNKMEQDIIKTIIESSNIDEAIEISKSIEKIKLTVIKKIADSLNEHYLDIEYKLPTGELKEPYIIVRKNGMYRVGLYFSRDLETLELGCIDNTEACDWIDSKKPKKNTLWSDATWNYATSLDFIEKLKKDIDESFEDIKE